MKKLLLTLLALAGAPAPTSAGDADTKHKAFSLGYMQVGTAMCMNIDAKKVARHVPLEPAVEEERYQKGATLFFTAYMGHELETCAQMLRANTAILQLPGVVEELNRILVDSVGEGK